MSSSSSRALARLLCPPATSPFAGPDASTFMLGRFRLQPVPAFSFTPPALTSAPSTRHVTNRTRTSSALRKTSSAYERASARNSTVGGSRSSCTSCYGYLPAGFRAGEAFEKQVNTLIPSPCQPARCTSISSSPFSFGAATSVPVSSSRMFSSRLAEAASEEASPASLAADYAVANAPRTDWSREEVQAIFDSPLMDLIFHGARVHRAAHRFREVQQCTLLSIKTGGCQEDCSYCSQSSKYSTGVKAEKLAQEDEVIAAARQAKEAGSTRFCMGAAWRSTEGRRTDFNKILNYASNIRSMGMEVCCTLGMLSKEQAEQLKAAGLTAYNHNLDTSREYYPSVITTRTYDDRLQTLENVREAGIAVCSGGILGLGEGEEDRVGLLHTLATLPQHPESVPINTLVAVKGTPLENQEPVSVWELVRAIGTARIVMPRSIVRLSAGRIMLSQPEQALCFLAGANSIFTGDKLLTTPNNDRNNDDIMFQQLGLMPMPSFRFESAGQQQAAA